MRRPTENNYKGSSVRTGIFLHPCRRRRRMRGHSYRCAQETCSSRRWSEGFVAWKKMTISIRYTLVMIIILFTSEVWRRSELSEWGRHGRGSWTCSDWRYWRWFSGLGEHSQRRNWTTICISGCKYPVWRTNHIQTRWWSPLCQGSQTRISRQNKDVLS